jgi:hypothetical protein
MKPLNPELLVKWWKNGRPFGTEIMTNPCHQRTCNYKDEWICKDCMYSLKAIHALKLNKLLKLEESDGVP